MWMSFLEYCVLSIVKADNTLNYNIRKANTKSYELILRIKKGEVFN